MLIWSFHFLDQHKHGRYTGATESQSLIRVFATLENVFQVVIWRRGVLWDKAIMSFGFIFTALIRNRGFLMEGVSTDLKRSFQSDRWGLREIWR